MKPKSLFLQLFMSAALTSPLNALADDGAWSTNTSECDINGNESMEAVVALTPTTNAPAGARGVAKIESENDDGAETATMELKLIGLNPGDYFLSVTQLSTGTNIVLGQITVGNGGDDDDQGEDNNDQGDHLDWLNSGDSQGGDHWIGWNWGGFTNWGSWTNWSITNWCNLTNRVTVTEAHLDLPAGLNPSDIGEIILSDTNGAPILTGDLVKPATNTVINISATVRLTAGTAAPAAGGVAQLQSTATKGKWQHHFNLTATGLDAKTNFRVSVNSKKAGATRSDKTGQVTIKKLPGRTPALRSVQLMDTQGNVAAGAKF